MRRRGQTLPESRFVQLSWAVFLACGLLVFGAGRAGAEEALASWYGPGYHGLPTASGEPYDASEYTVAHKTLPLGTELEVSYGGNSVLVTVNDRGPLPGERDLDLSQAAAEELGLTGLGVDYVQVDYPSGGTANDATGDDATRSEAAPFGGFQSFVGDSTDIGSDGQTDLPFGAPSLPPEPDRASSLVGYATDTPNYPVGGSITGRGEASGGVIDPSNELPPDARPPEGATRGVGDSATIPYGAYDQAFVPQSTETDAGVYSPPAQPYAVDNGS
jgi:rare lipoprotein A